MKKLTGLLLLLLILIAVVNIKSIIRIAYPVHFSSEVEEYSQKYNVDPFLIYSIIKVESKFNPYAKSAKKAIGLMQITPQTGEYLSRLIGEKHFSEEKLYLPDTNIKYGCYYVSKLYNDFGGDLTCMLAAYNGGEGNVRKWLSNTENRRLTIRDIPFAETRNYIQKCMKYYKIYKFLYEK